MKTTNLTILTTDADASGPSMIAPDVLAYMQTGILTAEVFKRLQEWEEPEVEGVSVQTPENEPMFGTHIREAVEIIRNLRK